MNRKQKIIVSITGIFIVLLAIVGLTYAYFLTRITGNENDKSISVTTANLSVTYNDDMDGDGEPDPLMVFEKIMPSNTTTYTKTFKVENTGNATASYSVVLDNMVNDFDRNQDLQYTLTREGTTGNVAEGNLVVGTKQILIPKVEIENEEIHIYTLTLKYIEAGVDQSIDMGKELSFRVNIAEETVTWDTAAEGTLLYALKNNQPNGTEITIPGQQASTANEKRILSVEDDYGTSYVYRGNVTNNYVNYSGMCWRIVRIQGDGTIKLILADEVGECDADTYNVNNTTSAFIETGKKITYRKNNNMSITISDKTDLIYETSDIPPIINSWKTKEVIRNEKTVKNLDTSKLVNTDWCNDMSIYSDDSYGFSSEDGITIVYKESEAIMFYYNYYYSALFRTTNPTLKCNMIGLYNSKALRYTSDIGMLTIDEARFAGEYNGNENYYLSVNTGQNNYWTLTPKRDTNEGWSAAMYGLPSGRNDEIIIDENSPAAVRPSIILRSDVILDVNVNGQNGTQTNPYVIK